MRNTRTIWMALLLACTFVAAALPLNAQDRGTFALFDAIQKQDVAQVKKLLESGVSANASINDASALMQAVGQNNAAIVKMLLDKGANPNAGYWGKYAPAQCPLIAAAGPKVGNFAIVKMLLEAGADVNWGKTGNPYNCQTALCAAKQGKNQSIIDLLVNYGGKEY